NTKQVVHNKYQFVGAIKSYFINNQQPVTVNGVGIQIDPTFEIWDFLFNRNPSNIMPTGPIMEIPNVVSNLSIHDFCGLLSTNQKTELVNTLNRSLFDLADCQKVYVDVYITDSLSYI